MTGRKYDEDENQKYVLEKEERKERRAEGVKERKAKQSKVVKETTRCHKKEGKLENWATWKTKNEKPVFLIFFDFSFFVFPRFWLKIKNFSL